MVKILKVRNLSSPRTVRQIGTGKDMRSAASFSDGARKRFSGKFGGVRKLMARDPAVANTRDDAVFDQFTNNANPKYDPSRSPGSVKVLDSTPKPPSGPNSGHQKVISRTLFNQNAGKTLKKR